MRSAFLDYADRLPIQLEHGAQAHGLGWGYEGVIRRVGEDRLPSGRVIAVEEVLVGCGHVHADREEAKACDGLAPRIRAELQTEIRRYGYVRAGS